MKDLTFLHARNSRLGELAQLCGLPSMRPVAHFGVPSWMQPM
jgi:hypothetical protein